MKLFTVGPVEMAPDICRVAAEPLPYFRTQAFSALLKELERQFLESIAAPDEARAVFLTASGSGAMEAAVTGLFGPEDKLLVIDGGSFGHRFAEICRLHKLPATIHSLPLAEDFSADTLAPYSGRGFTGLLIQAHETSIGKKLDLAAAGAWCRREGCLLVADCVSAYLVDDLDMEGMNIDLLLTASQKALALQPGLTLLACSKAVVDRIYAHPDRGGLYLNLYQAFLNAERGQTPFTPALAIIYQLRARLEGISAAGGPKTEVKRCADLAGYLRRRLAAETPFSLPTYSLSNGLTPVWTGQFDAYRLFEELLADGFTVTPCGGDLAKRMLRIGHMGNLTPSDYDTLLTALKKRLEFY